MHDTCILFNIITVFLLSNSFRWHTNMMKNLMPRPVDASFHFVFHSTIRLFWTDIWANSFSTNSLLRATAFEAWPLMFHDSHKTCLIYRHFFLCLYGTVVLGLILAGELKDRKVVYILTGDVVSLFISLIVETLTGLMKVIFPFYVVYYGIENSFSGLFPHVVQVRSK